MLSAESMVNSMTVPFGVASGEAVSGAGLCVGPMMKLPSAFAGGTSPSSSSVAATNPAVWGSRVGGVGRAADATFARPAGLER